MKKADHEIASASSRHGPSPRREFAFRPEAICLICFARKIAAAQDGAALAIAMEAEQKRWRSYAGVTSAAVKDEWARALGALLGGWVPGLRIRVGC